ncbi:unnamed protein product [Discula destructiva]
MKIADKERVAAADSMPESRLDYDPSDTLFEKRQTHYVPITAAAKASFIKSQPSARAFPSFTAEPLFTEQLYRRPRPSWRSKLASDRIYNDYKKYRASRAPLASSSQQGHGSAHSKPNMTQQTQQTQQTPPLSSSSSYSASAMSPDYQHLDPDAAFRESILDALADQDGAAYWRGVYGVDLTTIPRTKTDPATGEPVRTTDEERVAYGRRMIFEAQNPRYVTDQERRRKKMDEARKRHIEQSQRADQERRQRKERVRVAEAQRRIQEEIERSLRLGEDRKRRAAQKERFDQYAALWAEWGGEQAAIPWPTLSGGRSDITERGIRSFLVRGLDLKAAGAKEFLVRLKEQRVRWHPDKMQQRMGGKDKIEKDVMADITMIFQVIDTLYDDTRKSS